MLRIQLCPESELEDRFWYTYDVLGLFVVVLISWLAADLWLSNMRHETQRLNDATAVWDKQITEADPLVQKFKTLDGEIELLNRKIEALRRITMTHPEKLRPIVVLDQLQTLKPEGLWYNMVSFDDNARIHMVGSSTDSLLISEFLLGLRETMNSDTWTNDIRTQIGYQNIEVKIMNRVDADPDLRDLRDHLQFEASAEVAQKPKFAIAPSVMGPPPRSKNGFTF